MTKKITVTNNDYVVQNSKNGQKTVSEYNRQQQQNSNVTVWENYNSNNDNTKDNSEEQNSENNSSSTMKKTFSDMYNPANRAYTRIMKVENSFVDSGTPTDDDFVENNSIILSSGRIVETMDTIEDAGKRHLSFLTEDAPESGNISGSLNGYYENGTNSKTSIFLGGVENCWQNKNKNIYTRFNAIFGVNNVSDTSQEGKSKYVTNLAFDGRYSKNDFIYGAGVEFNSYTNNSQVLDIHVAGKHKPTGIGADLTRRQIITKDEDTGETSVVSNMKLKLDILSNKSGDKKSNDSTYTPFSFESDSSVLPSDVESVDQNARQLASEYIKPERKEGSDLDFEYTENRCGITYEYNHNFIEKKNTYLSVAPVIGLHDYTDQTVNNNNETFQMTGGLITQFGKKTADGQTFTGSITAITDRIVKRGSHPYDSNYLLASVQYNNPKAKLNAGVDAGALKSGDINLKYVNLTAEKQMKHSSISFSAGAAKYVIAGDSSNVFNAMATYKYNIPYKTKK